jgi:hypothetical protein
MSACGIDEPALLKARTGSRMLMFSGVGKTLIAWIRDQDMNYMVGRDVQNHDPNPQALKAVVNDEVHHQLQVMKTGSYVYSSREPNVKIYFFTLTVHEHRH